MKGLLGRRRRPVDVAARTEALQRAVDAGRGRLPDDLVASADAVLHRAAERTGLSGEHTVVALAGSTGSGKSSLFNAVAGLDLARVGVLRPTTANALACVWGSDGAGPLLDWLGVPRRHQVAHESPLDPAAGDDLGGLVLLDLPDHDSTVAEHRIEVDRLVKAVDVLVWVVDPQKYADAVLHEDYLRAMSGHGAVTVLALNQVDRLTPAERDRCMVDLRRLLTEDGLDDVPVLAVSATTGAGLADLREVLRGVAAARRAAADRIAADVAAVAQRMLTHCAGQPAGADSRRRADLVAALSAAAGVDAVVDAVRGSTVRRARAATGWPPTRWLGRLRPDPLRRLRLDRRDVRPELTRTSLPPAAPTTRARADGAVRQYVDAASAGASDTWVIAARARAEAATAGLPDALDQAVAGTRLAADHRPAWWRVAGWVQWAALATLLVGAGWLLLLVGLDYLQLPDPPLPMWGPVPVPSALALGGLAAGILVAVLCRLAAAVSGRRRAKAARARLRESVSEVAERLVVAPVEEELAALRGCRDAARVAAGG